MELNERRVELAIMTELVRDQVPVTVFLTNGFQEQGVIDSFDLLLIVLRCGDKQSVIYKHSISSIIPIRPLTSVRCKSKS